MSTVTLKKDVPNPNGASRGLRNNNPLNIEASRGNPWQGEITPSGDGRFAQFTSMALGYRAAFKLLDNYQRLHGCRVLADFINRWAPPVENSTHDYIRTVARRTGLSDVSQIDTHNEVMMRRIVEAMSYVENGIEADSTEVAKGWALFINR